MLKKLSLLSVLIVSSVFADWGSGTTLPNGCAVSVSYGDGWGKSSVSCPQGASLTQAQQRAAFSALNCAESFPRLENALLDLLRTSMEKQETEEQAKERMKKLDVKMTKNINKK